MEQNIFEVLNGLNGEVKGTDLSGTVYLEYNGSIKMERGNFSMKIYFWLKLYESKHKGILNVDEWDINDSDSYQLNGLPIDNLSSFKTKLTEWGFNGVGNKLDFTNEEQKSAIFMCVTESEELKKIFGKKFNIWNLLSVDEQMLLDLNYVIDKFKECGEHIKKQVATHYKIGEQKTLEQYKEKLKELTK